MLAITEGIGDPNIPSGDVAIVEEVPAGQVNVSDKEYDRALEQQAAAQELEAMPREGSEEYEALKSAALGELLDLIWIEGEAEELGISVTGKEVANQLDQIKDQNFPTPKAYKEFLQSSKFTQEEVDRRVKSQLLSEEVQEIVPEGAPKATNEEIADYYEANQASQFTSQPSRDVRILTNKDEAKIEDLEADSSPESWKAVAKKYAENPSAAESGGLQEDLSEEVLSEPLKADTFEAAKGELLGPIKFQGTFAVIEVVKLNPERTQTLDEARSEIATELNRQMQQQHFNEFVSNYQSKWRSRTFCAASVTDGIAEAAQRDQIASRCANVAFSGRPPDAPPACYEDDPEEGIPLECPAAVAQLQPALPGSVSVLQPEGERLPQRPIPLQAEAAEEGVPTEGPEGAAGSE